MTIEPGWYPVEGDPPGTVRAWDGTSWVGEPEIVRHAPLGGYATAVSALLGLSAIVTLLELGVRIRDIDRLHDWDAGPDVMIDIRRAASITRQFNQIATVSLPLAILTGIVFLVWFHRAYSNLRLLGGSSRHTPGGATAAWLIPVINLYDPLRSTFELRPFVTPEDQLRPIPTAVLIAWWTLYAGGSVGALVLLVIEASSVDGQLLWSYADAVTSIGWTIAALLAILIVSRVSKFQDSRLDTAR